MRWIMTWGQTRQLGGPWVRRWHQGSRALWVQPDALGALDVFCHYEGGWILLQGWLDNVAQLRHMVGLPASCGHEEVLLALWRQEGEQGLARCRGQLSVAAFDAAHVRLHVWRDALGLVPVWWAASASGPRGASTSASALVEALGLPPIPHEPRLLTWLLRDVWEDSQEDFIQGVRRLCPGHQLTLSAVASQVKPWWSPRCFGEDQAEPQLPNAQVPEALAQALTEALQAQRLGQRSWLCMSAGVDSSVLAGLMHRAQRAPVEALSMVCPSLPTCDESQELGALERALQVRAHRVDVSSWWPGGDALSSPLEDLMAGPSLHAGAHERAFFAWARDQLEARQLIGGFGADELLLCSPALAMRRSWQRAPWQSARQVMTRQTSRGAMLRQAGWWVGVDVLGAQAVGWLRQRLEPRRQAAARAAAAPWHDASRWVRAQAPPQAILAMDVHDPRRWASCRLQMTRRWGWELFVRTQWRHMHEVGVRLSSPYLDARVWELGLALAPEQLCGPGPHGERWWDKRPLRELMAQLGAPAPLAWRPKLRSFDKLIERGLVIEDHQGRWRALASASRVAGPACQVLIDGAALEAAFQAFSAAARRQFPGGAHVGSLSIWQALSARGWEEALASARALGVASARASRDEAFKPRACES